MSKYESMDHDQLWKLVENADPSALHGAGEHWQRVAADLRHQIGALQAEVRALQASGAWQGQAAEQFGQAVDYIVKSTTTLANDAETAGRALSSAGDALAKAKQMPPPPPEWKVAAAKALKYGAGAALPPAPGVNVIGGIVGRVIGERELQEMERDRQEAIRLVAAADAAYREAALTLDPESRISDEGPDIEDWKGPDDGGPRTSVEGRGGAGFPGVSGGSGGGGVHGYGGGGGVHGYGAGDGGLGGRVPAGGGALPGGGPLGSELEGVNPPQGLPGQSPGGWQPTSPGSGVSGGGVPPVGVLPPMSGGAGRGSGLGGGRVGGGGAGISRGGAGGVVPGGAGGSGGVGGAGRVPGGGGAVPGSGISGGRPAGTGAGGGRPTGAGGPAGMMGAHGAHGGAGGEQERERSRRPSYLVEDEDTWAVKKPTVPPVIE
ncbi:WXG100 family type VII secretion target [Carbonactinospora thermoautotrophica]|nr:WXG100 family type VII secretion target [Carbonactinospora thermoautotrophica]